MDVKKNGLSYRLAYGWTKKDPEAGNLCTFFWRSLFGLFVAWPAILLSISFGWVVRIIGAPIALIGFGCKPAGPSWRFNMVNDDLFPFERIERWPKLAGDIHIMPAVVALYLTCLVGVPWLLFIFIKHILIEVYRDPRGALAANIVFTFVAATVSAKTVMWFLTLKRKPEWLRITHEFLRAKKNRLCPMITFVD